MENLQVSGLVSIECGGPSLRVVPPHRHRSYTIGVALSGVHILRCRQETVTVGPGSVVLFNPDENHSALPGCGDGWSYCMLHIDEQLVAHVASSRAIRESVAFSSASLEDRWLGAAIRRVCKTEIADDSLETDELVYSLIDRLIADRSGTGVQQRESGAIARVCDHLRANMVAPGGLAALGRIAKLHPNYLLSVFRRQVGVSPKQFLDRVRVASAQDLIMRGESISMTAAAVGYSDQSHLTRNFQKLVGVTPGRYRALTISPRAVRETFAHSRSTS